MMVCLSVVQVDIAWIGSSSAATTFVKERAKWAAMRRGKPG